MEMVSSEFYMKRSSLWGKLYAFPHVPLPEAKLLLSGALALPDNPVAT